MNGTDSEKIRRFCGRQNLNKALNSLRGILDGIAADDLVNEAEAKELRAWIGACEPFAERCPFNELIPLLERSLAAGVVDSEELEDMRWFLARSLVDNEYYDYVTGDLQTLQGMLHGILADGEINQEEVEELSRWVDAHEHLAGCYPYDEIYSVVMGVLKDGRLDADEVAYMKAFFSEFVKLESGVELDVDVDLKRRMTTAGVCAVEPPIEFSGKIFCFTGESARGTKDELGAMVEEQGGRLHPRVIQGLDYLVVGANGNPAWVFCCYGRKIEQVVNMRKAGNSALIVHENDFWDALEDVR